MLEQVKTALGITGNYQDNTIQGYINEVIGFLTEGGVDETVINDNPGLVARGVADLWNYGSGSAGLSPYFWQRASQLALKNDSPSKGTNNYNDLLNKPEIEGITLMNNKKLTDFGLNKLSNRDIANIIGK